jgi:oxygen-independent coproporphyrinogen-3 oxidase
MSGLYVHVPFCRSICGYCVFVRRLYRKDLAREYLRVLRAELGGLPRDFAPKTIFIGGGTPTALEPDELEELLVLLAPWRDSVVEYTVEVNPGSVAREKVDLLAGLGVTRISLGVQSFREGNLSVLERDHRAGDVERTWALLEGRFRSRSVDLIFGVPGQTIADWETDLRRAISIGPDHVSAYGLSYEDGSVLARRMARAETRAVDEETDRSMFLSTHEILPGAGLPAYEISNFARAGHECLHNEGYWRQEDYLGVGPGSFSTLGRRRWSRPADIGAWAAAVAEGVVPPPGAEQLSDRDSGVERLLLGLRMRRGLALASLQREPVSGVLSEAALDRLLGGGFLEVEDGRLRISLSGLCVADRVLSELVA